MTGAVEVDRSANILRVFVAGLPAPQGSKDYMGRTKSGKGILVESSKAVKPWRADVREALLLDGVPILSYPADVPVHMTLTFVLPRPKSAPKRYVPAIKRPDVDKLVRAVLDASESAGLLAADSQVTTLSAHKRLATGPGDPSGCIIFVMPDC